MKKKIVLLMTVGVMALAGCGVAGTVSEKTDSSDEETVRGTETSPGTETASESTEEMGQGEISQGSEESPMGGNTVKEPEEEQYTWQEYTITLPESWVGRCVMEEHETGFLIYQKASYEIDDTLGFICSFYHTREPVEYGIGETLIAYTEDGELYYLAQPMDVACDTENENILGEYIWMCQQVPLLKASLQIAASNVHGNADEYMFPTSSILALDQEMLADFSANSLWIGRNEIYARHGRQFDNVYLQQYFERCTWYKGEIPAQEFQESVLNQTEKDNIKLLQAAEKEYDRQHPYPKKYQASEVAVEDLNGDGVADEISYRVMEQETGEVLCELTVNGETYIANELSDPELGALMTNPTMDCFYITDILEGDGVLEIAVLDEGPSDDWVNHFYQYDGTLHYIGTVLGFPFAEKNGGLNGFNGYGSINGELVIDLIETAYVQGSWRYDGNSITFWDWGWYEYLPDSAHVLYEDLPVYLGCEETSATAAIPAQEEVFFLGTDMERWILVKGKDGSMGYMLVEDGNIVELNKPAEEVFSGLQFSG